MEGHVQEWNLRDGSSALIGRTRLPCTGWGLEIGPDARLLFVTASSSLASYGPTWETEMICYNLEDHTSHAITTHGKRVTVAVPDPTGKLLLTGDMDGVVRVGPITGEEPHLLVGPG